MKNQKFLLQISTKVNIIKNSGIFINNRKERKWDRY